MCGAFSSFCSLPSLLSTVYQCDGCLSSRGRGGSWLGFHVLLSIGAVSIVELAAKSGSSRVSRVPNLHRSTKLFSLACLQSSWLILFAIWFFTPLFQRFSLILLLLLFYLVYLISFHSVPFSVTGAHAFVVLFYFFISWVGPGLVTGLWILLAMGVVPTPAGVGLLAKHWVVLGT